MRYFFKENIRKMIDALRSPKKATMYSFKSGSLINWGGLSLKFHVSPRKLLVDLLDVNAFLPFLVGYSQKKSPVSVSKITSTPSTDKHICWVL